MTSRFTNVDLTTKFPVGSRPYPIGQSVRQQNASIEQTTEGICVWFGDDDYMIFDHYEQVDALYAALTTSFFEWLETPEGLASLES